MDVSTLPPSGSIGLVAIEGIGGKAIAAAEWIESRIERKPFSDYEHAFVLDTASFAQPRVIEAEISGVRGAPLSEYAGRKVLWLPCPIECGHAMLAAARTYIGIPYSFADYVAEAAHLLHFDPLHLDEAIAGNLHRVICSQLAVACAKKAEWPLVPATAVPGFYSPEDLSFLAPAGAQPMVIS